MFDFECEMFEEWAPVLDALLPAIHKKIKDLKSEIANFLANN